MLAPHVFVEDESVAGIEAARDAYESTLRPRLAKYHDDVDATFWGWNGVWLSPEFRSWNIEPYLPRHRGAGPRVAGHRGPVRHARPARRHRRRDRVRATERLVLDGGGHVLHAGATTPVVDAVAGLRRARQPPGVLRPDAASTARVHSLAIGASRSGATSFIACRRSPSTNWTWSLTS